MAAPVTQAVGAGQTSTGAALSVPWPTHNPDDLGILVVESTGTATPMSTPTGWTAITGTPLVDVASVAGSTFYVWWKRATSSAEPNVATGAQTDHQLGIIYTFRGVINTGNPIDVSATATKAVASLTATMPTVTTSGVTELIVLIASRPNDSAATNHFSTLTNAALTGLIKFAEWGSTDGDGGGFGVATGAKATAGAVGTTTWTKGSSTTDTTVTIALLPMPTPPAAPTYRPPILTRRRSILRPNRRQSPTAPQTQTVVVVIPSYVPPIPRPQRRLAALRRRPPPQVPLTQTVVVVVPPYVPTIPPNRRRLLPARRGRLVATPLTQTAVVVVSSIPQIQTPHRRLIPARRGRVASVPVVAVTVVPEIQRSVRRHIPLRRGTIVTTPQTQTVAVVVTYTPPIQTPHRRLLRARRGTVVSVPVVAVAYVPPIQPPRRARPLLRRRTQQQTPPPPIVVVTYIPPIPQRRRQAPLVARRRTQPGATNISTAPPRVVVPQIARPIRRFLRLIRRQQFTVTPPPEVQGQPGVVTVTFGFQTTVVRLSDTADTTVEFTKGGTVVVRLSDTADTSVGLASAGSTRVALGAAGGTSVTFGVASTTIRLH